MIDGLTAVRVMQKSYVGRPENYTTIVSQSGN